MTNIIHLTQYPEALAQYRNVCKSESDKGTTSPLLGTTLLISPSPITDGDNKKRSNLQRDGFRVACLFTSEKYGKKVDPPPKILLNTKRALDHLANQINELKRKENERPGSDVEMHSIRPSSEPCTKTVKRSKRELDPVQYLPVGQCYAVRLNSGKFGVPWSETKRVLKDGPLDIIVMKRKGEPDESGDENQKHSEEEEDNGGDKIEGSAGVSQIKEEEDGELVDSDDESIDDDDEKDKDEGETASDAESKDPPPVKRARIKYTHPPPNGPRRDSHGRFVARTPTPDRGLWPIAQRPGGRRYRV